MSRGALVLAAHGITQSAIADRARVDRSAVSHQLKGRRSLQPWLLTAVGELGGAEVVKELLAAMTRPAD
jgi:transcriptional regulator with XRE-family HTH domain